MVDCYSAIGDMPQHGGITDPELRALGLDPRRVVDLSVSLNPLGPSPGIVSAIAAAPLDRYPDPLCRAGRAALADHCGAPIERIVLGNGASELIWSLLAAFGSSSHAGAQVVVAEPAFGQVYAACQALGLPVCQVRPREVHGCPALDVEALIHACRAAPTVCVYLCNPTTPVGTLMELSGLQALLEAVAPTPVLLDESFLALSDGHAQRHQTMPERVVRLRSLTKDFGIPGVRIGYAVVPPGLPDVVQRARPAWTVSAAAEAVACRAPQEEPHLAESRKHVSDLRQALSEGLSGLGLTAHVSSAPYLTFAHPLASVLARRLLCEHGIALRDCTSFGLSGLLRVGLPSDADRERLLAGLDAVLQQEL